MAKRHTEMNQNGIIVKLNLTHIHIALLAKVIVRLQCLGMTKTIDKQMFVNTSLSIDGEDIDCLSLSPLVKRYA